MFRRQADYFELDWEGFAVAADDVTVTPHLGQIDQIDQIDHDLDHLGRNLPL